MKKTISALSALAVAAAIIMPAVPALAEENIKVFVDGTQVTFDVNPIIKEERILVPLRAIFEALGAEVDWDQETRTASAKRGNDTVSVTIDSRTPYKNDHSVELDVPAQIVDERTLVPVRAISESFDCTVDWDGKTQSAIITTVPEATATPDAASESAVTVAPESTIEPTAAATPEIIDSLKLSQKDMDTLTTHHQPIRYLFEQINLPRYAFESKTLYEDMNDPQGFADIIYDQWYENGCSYILQLQQDSDTVYSIPDGASEEALEATFKSILTDAGIDAESMFTGVTTYDYNNGELHIGIVIFKDASTLVDCKYLGIVTDKNGKTRYFTAENDIMDTENWYVCEVTAQQRGTISVMPKNDNPADELKNFCDGIIKCYKNDTNFMASLVRPLFPQN